MRTRGPALALTIIMTAAALLSCIGCGSSSASSAIGNLVDTVAGEHTPEPTPTPSDELAFASVEYQVSPRTVPFGDMIYARPDPDALVAQISELTAQFSDATTEEQALSLMAQAQNIYDNFNTAETLAMIHNSMDYSDEYWQEQYQFCAQSKPAIQQAMTAFNQALATSAVGRAAGLEPSRELYQYAAVVPLLQSQANLVNQYNNMLGTATAELSGDTFTFSECVSDEMVAAWIAQNAEALGSIYLELVQVRNELAAVCGYNNYIEFIYAIDEKDYTPGMVSTLLDRIATSLAPIYTDINIRGVYAIDIRLSQEELFEDMRRIFLRLDPELEAALQFMRDYNLYDFSIGPNKSLMDYTTYIVNYAAPFLMASFDGSWDSMSGIINEFGHFFNYTVDEDAEYSSLDTLEIFSLALELMVANKYNECFSDDNAYMMLYNTLANAYAIFPYQAYLTAFESRVYTLEDEALNYDNLCRISVEEWNRFGLGADSPIAGTDWVTTPHIYESPFYPVSYITSADVAMQIWERALVDSHEAMTIYMALMNGAKEGKPFLTNVQEAGLTSPFDEGEVATLAGFFRNYLIYEAGMYADTSLPFAIQPAEAVEASAVASVEVGGTDYVIPEPSGHYGSYVGFADGTVPGIVATAGPPMQPSEVPLEPTSSPTPSNPWHALDHRWNRN